MARRRCSGSTSRRRRESFRRAAHSSRGCRRWVLECRRTRECPALLANVSRLSRLQVAGNVAESTDEFLEEVAISVCHDAVVDPARADERIRGSLDDLMSCGLRDAVQDCLRRRAGRARRRHDDKGECLRNRDVWRRAEEVVSLDSRTAGVLEDFHRTGQVDDVHGIVVGAGHSTDCRQNPRRCERIEAHHTRDPFEDLDELGVAQNRLQRGAEETALVRSGELGASNAVLTRSRKIPARYELLRKRIDLVCRGRVRVVRIPVIVEIEVVNLRMFEYPSGKHDGRVRKGQGFEKDPRHAERKVECGGLGGTSNPSLRLSSSRFGGAPADIAVAKVAVMATAKTKRVASVRVPQRDFFLMTASPLVLGRVSARAARREDYGRELPGAPHAQVVA